MLPLYPRTGRGEPYSHLPRGVIAKRFVVNLVKRLINCTNLPGFFLNCTNASLSGFFGGSATPPAPDSADSPPTSTSELCDSTSGSLQRLHSTTTAKDSGPWSWHRSGKQGVEHGVESQLYNCTGSTKQAIVRLSPNCTNLLVWIFQRNCTNLLVEVCDSSTKTVQH